MQRRVKISTQSVDYFLSLADTNIWMMQLVLKSRNEAKQFRFGP